MEFEERRLEKEYVERDRVAGDLFDVRRLTDRVAGSMS